MNYNKIYNILINFRRENPINRGIDDAIVEYHHIVPIACKGENTPRRKEFNIQGSNLVGLTLREHFVAHKLLEKIYQNTQYGYSMTIALWKMSITRKGLLIKTSRQFEKLRSRVSKAISVLKKNKNTGKYFANNGYKNIVLSKDDLIPLGFVKGKIIYNKKSFSQKLKNSHKSQKGFIWVNNGIVNKFVNPLNIPNGFVKGQIPNKKLKERHLGKIWINNGIDEKLININDIEKYANWNKGRIHSRIEKWIQAGHNVKKQQVG